MNRFNKIKKALFWCLGIKQHDNYLDFNNILEICCFEFGVTKTQLYGKSRKQEIIFCRKAFCQIVKEKFDVKNEFTAKIIGKSQQDVSRYLRTQPNNKHYNITLEKIRKRIK